MKLNFPLKPDLNEDFIYNLANQNMSASAVDLATGQAMAQDILVYNKEIARLRAALERIFNEVTSGPSYPFSDVGVIAKRAQEEVK